MLSDDTWALGPLLTCCSVQRRLSLGPGLAGNLALPRPGVIIFKDQFRRRVAILGPMLTFAAVAAYGAFHSFLASFWAKRRARRVAGPFSDRVYRLAFNAIGAVTFLPVMAVLAMWPGAVLYRIGWPWIALTSIGQLAAAGLLLLGLLQTDVWHFLGLRQLLRPANDRPPRLVVTGLYRWVRHPLYTAGLIFLWLVPIMTTSLLALNFGLTLYIYVGSIFEERRLHAEFGQLYSEYSTRVPRLFPDPRKLGSPSLPSSEAG